MGGREQAVVVYLSGHPWDGVRGTDRHLATALSRQVPVLWIDPPVPALAILRSLLRGEKGAASTPGMDVIGDNICRVRVLGPPGLTRPVLRSLGGCHLRSRVARLVRNLDVAVLAVVVANPEGRFPRIAGGRRVFFVTDDWPAGAGMMGLSRRRIERLLRSNLRAADATAAVTPQLLERVLSAGPAPETRMVLANGCDPRPYAGKSTRRPLDVPDDPFAILVGQINERIDLAMVRAVADSDLAVVVVGPRTEREPDTAEELDRLFEHPMVSWLGPHRPEQLPGYLHAASVGLTPYLDNEFNRASFPLKTLEYLAAGLPVVSTDLPAARWLNTSLVTIAAEPGDFASKARSAAMTELSEAESQRLVRQRFAREHSWDSRATELLAAL
jgi:teichuronic acid biosynthesis glycosyltransferase TuaH